MKNEADVKKEIKKILNAAGAWWYMPVQTGYGVRGIPDFVGCLCGRFFGIEAKFGSNTESTWQKRQGKLIKESGGAYTVINDKNLHTLEAWLAKVLDA